MNVVMVGTGNVAMVLSQLLVKAGHNITEVYGRNMILLQQLAGMLDAKANTNFSDIRDNADICVLAVSDAAIASLAAEINVSGMMVVHTSGATAIDKLQKFSNHGVLYPLQSLRKELPYLPQIPFFVQANNRACEKVLYELAASLSPHVNLTTDAERLKLHMSAVLCSNFTNHLYALTQQYCRQNGIDFQNLLPLITETANRLSYLPAEVLQTGPAVRGDEASMQRHLALLSGNEQLAKLYSVLSGSIQQFHAAPER